MRDFSNSINCAKRNANKAIDEHSAFNVKEQWSSVFGETRRAKKNRAGNYDFRIFPSSFTFSRFKFILNRLFVSVFSRRVWSYDLIQIRNEH